MDAVINNIASVSRAAFGGRKKLMTAAANLMTEVKEDVSNIPGLMKVIATTWGQGGKMFL